MIIMNFVTALKSNPLTTLNFATFLQYQRFVMPISFLFYLQNGLNFSDFILCQSLYSATCLIGKFVTGCIGDIFSKKYIIITAYFLFMLRVILWINFSGFWIVLTGEILYGLFKALYRGNVDSYIYEYLKTCNKEEKMISKYGRLSFYNSLGSAISCFIGVILYKYYGFKTILILELITQIIAVSCLFLLPNIKIQTNEQHQPIRYINSILSTAKNIFKNNNINYFIYYSAALTGLTGVFVWNFQPLLKFAAAPIIFYGIINFINQILRAAGGIYAEKFTKKFKSNTLIIIEYVAVIFSFALLILGYHIKNYIFIITALFLICLAILLFVIFNVFTVSQLHSFVSDDNRAASASVNSFVEDFTTFISLLSFRFVYDHLGITNSLIMFTIIAATILLPIFYKKTIKY